MRSAAVGFQCPTCVAEGSRSTRQGRTAYGGRRSGNPALTSIVLVAINVAIWLGIVLTGGQTSRLTDALAQLGMGRCQTDNGYYPQVHSSGVCSLAPQAHWVPGVADGAPWQLLTSAFTHVEVWHIGFNMLALWLLGPTLEAVIGRTRFLALYLLSALAGSTVVLFSDPYTQTLGASGAIFGLMAALLVIALKSGGNVSQIGTWILINAVFTFTVPHISWQGHLGGFIGGLLITAAFVYAPKARRGLWQGAAVAAYVAVLAGLLLVRIGQLG
jgi:membrane associated rhomboid family serine protease